MKQLRSDENVYDHKCNHCAFETGEECLLNAHIDGTHEPTVIHKCGGCDFVSYYKKSLKLHKCMGGLSGSLGEVSVKRVLRKLGISYKPERAFEIKNAEGNYLRWDFKIVGLETLMFIEYNGLQHYEAVKDFGGEDQLVKQMRHDKLKAEYCKRKGYPLLWIRYDEVDVEGVVRTFVEANSEWKLGMEADVVDLGIPAPPRKSWGERQIELFIDTPTVDNFANTFHPANRTIYAESSLKPYETTSTLLVKAPMAIGKTKALREHMEKNFSAICNKIIFVSFRRTFTANIKSNFTDFESYMDLQGELTQNRLIIQVDSLHRLKTMDVDPPDLVIFDESESIIEQMSSGLMGDYFPLTLTTFARL